MILVRNTFQAKVGRAGDLAHSLAESMRRRAEGEDVRRAWRVLTDVSGPFHTVVLEIELESLATWEQGLAALFASPAFQADLARSSELMVSGSRQFYTIEASG